MTKSEHEQTDSVHGTHMWCLSQTSDITTHLSVRNVRVLACPNEKHFGHNLLDSIRLKVSILRVCSPHIVANCLKQLLALEKAIPVTLR